MKWANNRIITCISVRLSIENASITQSTDYKHKGLSESDLDPFALPTPFVGGFPYELHLQLQININKLLMANGIKWRKCQLLILCR